MDIRSYKNIIFDLGGVIIDIDPEKAVEAFAKHVYKTQSPNGRQLYNKIVNGMLLMDYEKGEINDAQFRSALNERLDITLSDEDFDRAFNALLLDYTQERLRLLESLKKTHKIFLLSNTCHIHFVHYNQLLKDKYGYSDLSDLFDRMFLSFEMGMRKPDTRIFQKVIDAAAINPGESVFIHDSLQNVEAARSVGLGGFHKPQEVDLITIFKK